MKILVTGGHGFIGSAVVERLLKEKHEITIIDDLSTGNLENINKKVRTFNISTADKNCGKIFKDTKFDVVVQLANKKISRHDIESHNDILQLNNAGIINILYFSQKYKVSKFIMLSPYTVYGKQDVLPIKENFKLSPIEEEGLQGLINEFYCEQYRKIGLDVTILRVGEIYGPRQNNEKSFIYKLLTMPKLDKEKVLEINNNKLDYIFIGDVVEAIKIACESHTPDVINISTGKGTSQNEILGIFSRISHKYDDIYIKPTNDIEQVYILDNEKAISELGWYPKYELLEGIKKTINLHKDITYKSKADVPKKEKISKFNYQSRNNNYRNIEIILLFLVFSLANYLLRYRLGVKIDLFILYIVFINLIYGFKQGSLAVVLSIVTNILFKFKFEDMKTFNLINDPSNLLYSTMYFIIGVSIGNIIDRMKADKQVLAEELEDTAENMRFAYEIHEKSIEIKNRLQNKIEKYDDSFQKTLDVITRLEKLKGNEVLPESRKILSEVLQLKSIYIYSINHNENYVELISSPDSFPFKSKLIIDEHEFLKSIIHNENIFINKTLEKSIPTIVAPLFQNNKLFALIFIDEIEFESLNYQFINTLKVLTYLISNRLSNSDEYIKTITNN